MPRSVPWSAPEHHNRYFNPQAAKAMDVYSFGMMCLWLIFGEAIFNESTLSSPIENHMQYVDFKDEFRAKMLESWKSDSHNELLKRAVKMSQRYSYVNHGLAQNWVDFFRCTLALEPQARSTDFGHLLQFLNPTS